MKCRLLESPDRGVRGVRLGEGFRLWGAHSWMDEATDCVFAGLIG